MNTTNNIKNQIGSRVLFFCGKMISKNEVSSSESKRRESKVNIFGQVVLLSGPNVWRVLWDGVRCKNLQKIHWSMRMLVQILSKKTFLIEAKVMIFLVIFIILTLIMIFLLKLPVHMGEMFMVYSLNRILCFLLLLLLLLLHSGTYNLYWLITYTWDITPG